MCGGPAARRGGDQFTTHVVGFDVFVPPAPAQMQCIADETGGQFLTASNADELDLAMTEMVMAEPAPEPEPQLTTMTFTAVIGDDKTLIDTPILWEINEGDTQVVANASANPFTFELPEGAYTASAYSVAAEETGDAQFIVIGGGAKPRGGGFVGKTPPTPHPPPPPPARRIRKRAGRGRREEAGVAGAI